MRSLPEIVAQNKRGAKSDKKAGTYKTWMYK